jgi:integral membrane protein
MSKFLIPGIGQLRLIGFLEGISFLVLVFIAMPIKYWGGNPVPVQIVGQAHGLLFVLFVVYAVIMSVKHKWKLGITLQVLASSIIPFGTFYIDKKILSKM